MFNKILSGLITAIVFTGCAATPPTQFYELESVSKPMPAISSTKKPLVCGIGPLSLPSILDRKQIVTRTANNEVKLAEFDQWAAPLTETVDLVISQNLTSLLPQAIFRRFPWSAYGTVDYYIIIDISEFDTRPGQSVNFEANFAVMDDKKHTIISNGHFKVEHPLIDSSYAGSVKALSQVLAEFSQRLVLTINQIY